MLFVVPMSMNFQGYRRYNSVTITYVHKLLPFPNMANSCYQWGWLVEVTGGAV